MQAPPARTTAPIQPRDFLSQSDYVKHILKMKNTDPDYARYALKQYASLLPELDLMQGVREALK